MWKDAFRSIGVIFGVSFLVAAVMRLSGIVEDFSFWWGIFAVLILPPLIGWFLNKHFEMTGKIVTMVIGVVYLVVATAILPIIVEHFARKAPFTSEALGHRGVDTDVRTADGIKPAGTGLRVVAAAHRAKREAEITAWAQRELTSVHENLRAGKIDEKEAEQREKKIMEEKAANLRAVLQNVRYDPPNPPPKSASSSFLPTLPDFRNILPASLPHWVWPMVVFVLMVVAIVLLYKLTKPIKWGLVRVPIVLVGAIVLLGWYTTWLGQQFARPYQPPGAGLQAARAAAAEVPRPEPPKPQYPLDVVNCSAKSVNAFRVRKGEEWFLGTAAAGYSPQFHSVSPGDDVVLKLIKDDTVLATFKDVAPGNNRVVTTRYGCGGNSS